jgi:hypothetical protein
MKQTRSCLAFWVVMGWIPLVSVATDEARCSEQQACTTRTSGDWTICESANFRFCCRGTKMASRQTVLRAERLRSELADKWLGDAAQDVAAWTPKCDIILHATLGSYLRAVPGGEQTVGSSLIEADRGKVATRRIDIRADKRGWFAEALAHELTHVILADVFPEGRVPHWADEGMAVLADPMSKQQAHFRDLRFARSAQSAFRVIELLSLEGYPQPHRQAAFYGQSASIVRFLVERESPSQFVKFIQTAEEQGYERALRNHYQIDGVRHLESLWGRYAQAAPAKNVLVAVD